MSKVIRSFSVQEGYYPLSIKQEVFSGREAVKLQSKGKHANESRSADQVIAEARAEAERIIGSARQEAEKIVKQAKAQEDRIARTAKERGLQEGYKEGIAASEEEAGRMREEAMSVLNKAAAKTTNLLQNAEEEVVELAMDIASKVVRSHVLVKPETVAALAREALERSAAAQHYSIFVNPDDVGLLEQYISELRRGTGAGSRIHIVDDPGIERGGCRIETESGLVDMTLESQLEQIRRVLREEFNV